MKEYIIGIDAGGTKVAYGLFDRAGNLLDRCQHPTDVQADGPALCDRMIGTVGALLEKNGLTDSVQVDYVSEHAEAVTQMAAGGADYKEILTHYYTGVTVEPYLPG